MELQRIDRMTELPVVGQFYLVPVVRGKWYSRLDAWPVMGPQHSDPNFFNFPAKHYHIDTRFLTVAQRKYGTRNRDYQSAPLMTDDSGARPEKMPAPTFKRRKCTDSMIIYRHGDRQPIPKIRAHYAGRQCAGTKGNWVCPHQKARLGSMLAINGIITCPLHGLSIDAETGIVCPVPSAQRA